ncbi:hypothetical protein K1W54_04635 [Micromonospora sp. CPCC 205371]|nr:hypothetical protein [Micromonospora sp. CPCC 205371]
MHGKRLDGLIGHVEALTLRVLRAVAQTVAKLIGDSPSPAALSDDDLQVMRREWTAAVEAQIVPALGDVYAESAQVLAKEFADVGREVEPVSLNAPDAADFLDAATNRLVAVSDTLWEVARKELADGVRAGEVIEELAARLQDAGGFGEARARMIARTEVVAAANSASLAQALRLGDASMRKEWLATMEDGDTAVCDERTREAHCAAHEQVQPLGEPFRVGGTWLMYPGQPIGPADEVINCRCTQGFLLGDELVDEPLTAAGPDEFHLPGKHDQSEHGKDGPNTPDSAGERAIGGGGNVGARAGRDPTSVGETVKTYGSKSLTLAAHEDGQLSLTDDSGNNVRLTAANIDELRTNALYSYDMEIGDEFTIRHTEDRDGAPYTTLRMLVQKTAVVPEEEIQEGEESYLRDTLAVHLAPNDDPDFDELRATPPVEMTARELADLAVALTDLETAGRVDTGHGQLDMFTDGRTWVFRPTDGPELRLNRRGFRTLDQALGAVADAFDGENDSRSGAPLGEGETAEQVIDTNIGPVTVSLTGGLDVGDLKIRAHDHDVEIVVAPAQQATFLRRMGLLSEVLTASAAQRRVAAMTAAVPSAMALTAAAEVHTGAMVALRPSVADAERLAVDGGEPAAELHATLAYLGAASDIPVEAQERIIEAIFEIAEGKPVLTVEGFAVSAFNPGDSNDREPCIVLGLSGEGLDDVHGHVLESLHNLQTEPAGFTLPEQHAPWQPHITLIYTDDVSTVEKLADRVGPVTFDAIRVAFAGEVFDIPLGEPVPEEDDDEGDGFDWDAYFAAAIPRWFQSRMPPQLRRYWARKLRLGTKGSFDRCVRELREYFPEDTEGLCANLYHEVTGRWPGRKKDHDGGDASALAAAPEPAATSEADEAGAADEAAVAANPLAAQPGEHFHTWAMEGVSTGLREFAPGSITWRTPPFAYHDQVKSSAHGGVPETVQTGLITRAERIGDEVHFWGRLDLRSPSGLDYARRLAEGWARWSSVGPDESVKDQYIDVEYVLTDEPDDGIVAGEPAIDLMTFNHYRVAEITAVSVPALADARVEPTQELLDTLAEMGVIVSPTPVTETESLTAAAVRPHDTPTTEGTWDADANVARLPSPLPVTKAREEFAWIDDSRIEGDHIPKDAASLPHHEVSEDGRVGAANVDAVRNALARLSQTDIPESEREAVHAHLARHLEDAGGTPSEFTNTGPSVIVAAGHTITIPDVPPVEWFTEPTDVEATGALTITDEGRIYGYLAPAGVAHRGFRNRRVEVPRGNVDYSRWMGGEAIVAGGGRVVAGPITMNCGHLPPHASSDPATRMEHYDNTCSVVAQAAIGENDKGVWIAGALLPGVSAEQVSRMLACRLSGDWAPHPEKSGMREFVAALLVPVPGFPMGRSAPSKVRIAHGALVASAVPVRFADEEIVVEIEEDEVPVLAEGTRVRVVDPRDPEVTEGEVAVVHAGPAYALLVPGREEPHRWYVAEEIEPVGDTDEPDEVAEMVASASPDLRPVLERIAKTVGLDAKTRLENLRARIDRTS